MLKSLGVVALALVASSPANAQAVESTVAASNGVEVTVYSDEFANRYEYSAPAVKLVDGFVLVSTVKKAGTVAPVQLVGAFTYSGEWRRYTSAIYRGGDAANYTDTGRNVGRCSSSRYSRPSCTLTEQFSIEVSSDDIKKHAQDGSLAIQVRAQDTTTALLNVPLVYFQAVEEVSHR